MDNGTKRNYVQPDKQDFIGFLNSSNFDWKVADVRATEIVFETNDICEEYHNVWLRIYSTIDKKTGKARSKGSDAIRTVLYDSIKDEQIGGKKKTLRIETWKKNLRKKLDELDKNWNEYVNSCEECDNGWLIAKEGKYGKFLGCTNYDECTCTRPIEEDDRGE